MSWTQAMWKAVKAVANSGVSGSKKPVTTARLNAIGAYLLARTRRVHPSAVMVADAAYTRWKIVIPA